MHEPRGWDAVPHLANSANYQFTADLRLIGVVQPIVALPRKLSFVR
jgi:hypothetical protein